VQQRHALGLLFVLLALSFAGIAWSAGHAREWVVAAAAAALGAWLGSLAVKALRPRRRPR
jgi:uncharacterized membrane protein YfcA